jgi:hypothetical protein
MKIFRILLMCSFALLSFSAAAALTVQSGDYDHTFSDPNVREDADQDWQDDRDEVQAEGASQAKQNVQNNMNSRMDSGRR